MGSKKNWREVIGHYWRPVGYEWKRTSGWISAKLPFSTFLRAFSGCAKIGWHWQLRWLYWGTGSCPGPDMAHKARSLQKENPAGCTRWSDGRPYWRTMSHIWEETTSWRSTYDGWAAESVVFHLFLTSRLAGSFRVFGFVFFWVGWVCLGVCLLVASSLKFPRSFA